jgi:S-DNA-T family DNA segregation ATPase FtsK/SpoIIIE
LAVAEMRSGSLWRDGGADVRVGIGARTSKVVLTGHTAPVPPTHDSAPVTVDLASVGVLGVHGDRKRVISSTVAVLSRLAAGMPPSRLEVDVVLADAGNSTEWDFAIRLPHIRTVAVANEAGALVDDLLVDIARREDADRVRAPPRRPLVVVVVVDAWPAASSALGDVPRRGPVVGVLVVALAESRLQLPSTCGADLSLGQTLPGCRPVATPPHSYLTSPDGDGHAASRAR